MNTSQVDSAAEFSTLVELLQYRAKHQAEKKAFIFLVDGETEGPIFTYQELDKQARAIGALLQGCTKVGDRALLLYPPGLEFIAAFFGCLYAGVMAVPAYPPKPNRPMPRLQSIISDSQATVALTVESIFSGMEKRFATAPDLKAMSWFVTDKIEGHPEENWKEPGVDSETIAFLQYTSGSTAAPKGVMVSHGNLIHNEFMVRKAYGHSENTIYLSWLPLFHDMGLIGNMLQSAYLGSTCILMAPAAFLQKPYRWLKAISDYKANTSGGPNFAYDLCVKMISPEQIDTLDLSSWKAAFNGAEPVRSSTLDSFARTFERAGFKADAYYPCYGLAEATLFVTGLLRQAPPVTVDIDSSALGENRVVEVDSGGKNSQRMVSCGPAWLDQEIVIVDPETLTPCPTDRVGEIWISGKSMAKGYWNRKEETEYTFHAYLKDSGRGPFMRTGDLGFVRQGELFITGRLKDLIIIRGKNHYPQDIELTVEECSEALRKGCGAAFSVDAEGEERLVIVQELERSYRHKNHEEVFGAIRKVVSKNHELNVYAIVLVMPGSIPKTSSGKIQRRACKADFLSDKLETVSQWKADLAYEEETTEVEAFENEKDVEAWLLSTISSKIGVESDKIDLGRPVTHYGLDSMSAIELMHAIEIALGVAIPVSGFFEDISIAQMISDIQAKWKAASAAAEELPAKREGDRNVTLSRGQRALWFIQQMQSDNTSYNIARAVMIRSELDTDALKRSMQRIVDRHPILRTTFGNVDGEPVQQVAEAAEVCFSQEDASGWSEGLLKERMLDEAYRPFDLEKGPLFRVKLFLRADRKHILLLSLHHIITDFWSLAIFMKELGLLYSEEKSGIPANLAPVEIDYAEYVNWQEDMLTGEEGKRLFDYWKNRLSGEMPVLNLPMDRPRPLVQTYNGASVSFEVPVDVSGKLKKLAKDRGATLYMVLLAAYQVLLHRYTGQEDILVGSPTAGRDRAQFSNIMGYFINPIVLRASFYEKATFSEFLAQVRKNVLEAYEHQSYPFPLLVEQLQPERDPGHSPLFQVMFALQKAHMLADQGLTPFALGVPGAEMQLGELVFRSVELEQKTAQFDLTATFAEMGEGLIASLEYNTDLFDASTIRHMARHFRVLLKDIADHPEQDVMKLQVLNQSEREILLQDWNNTVRDYPDRACVHRLFERQVQLTPDEVAVVFEDEKLTYKELNTRANRLAHYLAKQGVGPEMPVGIYLERNLNLITGVLGILKAGGTYIPLDPAYPQDRLEYMVEDSGLTVLLTSSGLAGNIGSEAVKAVCIDAEWEAMEAEPAENPVTEAAAENLAYIIYTSGSTGKPKGVQIPHRAVVNFLNSMRREPGITSKDVLLSVTTLSFDIAALEIFLPITSGARVVIQSREAASDGAALIKSLSTYKATIMQATPATWKLMIESGWQGKRDLKVLCGGEALSKELADQLLKRCGSLWNMYGPTETTIWSAVCNVKSGDGPISIGRPIDNTQIYILNPALELVPVGVTGELFIGGDGLAREYSNRPELTAEKFIPNPFSNVPWSRIYRTGDLARWMPDGNIEVLGRIDHQVKIRGFRIELGEIESVLRKHPGISEAVVAAKEVLAGDMRLVAYFTASREPAPTTVELRNFLKNDLPEYMLPAIFMQVDAMPLTPNGKVDRRALPVPEETGARPEAVYSEPQSSMEQTIAEIWKEVLRIEKVGVQDNFFDLGGHSLLLSRVYNKLVKVVDKKLTMVDMFRYPTIKSLAKYIGGDEGPSAMKNGRKGKRHGSAQSGEIAVVGMAGRFPGAKNVEEFWKNLRDGVESVRFFSEEELRDAGVDEEQLKHPAYVKARAILEDVENFDASFFGFSPREAQILDPQHRLFLECAWEVLEDAGCNAASYDGRIGIYAGVGLNHYLLNLYSENGLIDSLGTYQTFIGNDKDFVPTRVSYKLNLKGPSINVQTACSSSLVAVHLARQSLLNGECDMVLAGGVSIRTPQKEGYIYQEGGIPSSDGHCRAFDIKADGTIFGNGVAIVALKRLKDAMADGDCIHAVIKGTALNNDGSAKVGYTAPSVEGQAEVIREALATAGVDADTVTYIEAHGTGTKMGDPIEIAALKEAYKDVDKKECCAVGSVKTNIGHLDTAAGAAGLIKTVLALKHKMLPPSLNFEQPNPQLGLEGSPFYINNRLSSWETGNIPRRAGISSFGIGGTNAHIILEEAPASEEAGESAPWKLLLLSTKTETALDKATANLADYLKAHGDQDLADVAYTLQAGRQSMNHRRMAVCRDVEDAAAVLEAADPQRVFTGYYEPGDRNIAFMFPGQGSQYVHMAYDLYRDEPVFRDTVDRCCKLLKPHLGLELGELIYTVEENTEEAAAKLQQTNITQPALFVIEYSTAKLWMEWGIQPQAMIGHSIGEYVAACLAGVFELEDALALVAARGRLMQSLPAGSMVSVSIPEKQVLPYLEEGLSVAAVNGPALCVVSGPTEKVEQLEKRLTEANVVFRRLHTSHAFHSHMMDPILRLFEDKVKRVKLKAPHIPFVSNLTGTWITEAEAVDPAYWVKHLRQAVRFADGVKKLLEDEGRILLEVGPGQALSTFARQQMDKSGRQVVLPSIRHPQDKQPDTAFILNTLGRLWLAGVQADWSGVYANGRRRKVSLPGYPFEGQRYWIDVDRKKSKESKPASNKKQEISRWFYIPSWKKSMAPMPGSQEGRQGNRLVFAENSGLSARFARALEGREQKVVSVIAGEVFARTGDNAYIINPALPEDYQKLLEGLKADNQLPESVIHFWNVGNSSLEDSLNSGFYSLVYLAQAIGRMDLGSRIQIDVVTSGMHKIESRDVTYPEKALLTGPLKVIPQEYSNLSCRCIDIGQPEDAQEEDLIELLTAETMVKSGNETVAYRGLERWVQSHEAVEVDAGQGLPSRIREGGVYLLTGGLGGIGLEIAGYLAEKAKAKLVLTGRSSFPEKEEWGRWIVEHAEDDGISRKIKRLQALEALGAEITVLTADVAEESHMQDVVKNIIQKYSVLHGVIHAAGIPGGGMIQFKTREAAEKVLLPKVKGTLALHSAVKDLRLDFFLLCSSINAVIGGFGQVDYTSANAFLDAFARSLASRRGTYVASINWDRWKDTGMTAEADQKAADGASGTTRIDHPLLDKCTTETLDRDVYATEFRADKHWVLYEHTIAGNPTIPGTTYLEMARAAFQKHVGGGDTEIREVAFMTPLAVKEGEARETLTILEKEEQSYRFRVISRLVAVDGKAQEWSQHAMGKIDRRDPASRKTYNIQELISKCNIKTAEVSSEDLVSGPERFVGTGPRWNNLRKVHFGVNEALTVLELPVEFSADLDAMKLHPALMDVATGSVQRFIGEGNYLPLAYEKLTVKAPMTSRMYGYSVFKDSAAITQKDTLTCDISILDEQGSELIEVKGFTMKRVSQDVAAQLKDRARQEVEDAVQYAAAAVEPAYNQLLGKVNWSKEDGISAAEGVEVFERILSGSTASQIIVSTKDLAAVIHEVNAFNKEKIAGELGDMAASKPVHARPRVNNAYTAPDNELEQTISEVWQKILGIEQVGVHDNFFELGGTSLTGIQVVSELKKALNAEIPTVSIFEAPTVSLMAKLLNPEKGQQSFDHTRDRAEKKKDALDRQRKMARERRK